MRGIVFDIKKYAIHDGPGIRTTVFLKGCPLRCWWCHNPESQKIEVETITQIDRRNSLELSYSETKNVFGKAVPVQDILREIDKDVSFYDESGGGVTFSGGEPLMQPDFLMALLQTCKEREIHTAVDTSGYAPWQIFERILPLVDLFLYDLKLMDDVLHQKYTGVSNKRLLGNLKKLATMHRDIRIRVPVIPGITDSRDNLESIATFAASRPNIRAIHLLPYNPIGEDKYRRLHIPQKAGAFAVQSDAEMQQLKALIVPFGVNVKIGG